MILPTNRFQSSYLILFRHQFRRYVEHLFECETLRVHNGLTIVHVIRSHEYCWFHCYSHKHSPNHRMFASIFCNMWNSCVFFRTWSFNRFTNDLDSTDNSSSVSSFPMTPRSVTKCFLVHKGLRGSVVKSFLVRETKSNFSCHSPRSFIRSPRSLVCLNISCPLYSNQKLSIGLCRYQVVPIAPLS